MGKKCCRNCKKFRPSSIEGNCERCDKLHASIVDMNCQLCEDHDLIVTENENHIISPTGLGIRIDGAGGGYYGAPRGNRKHTGIDFLCKPGQDIVSPISGKLTRIARPYREGDYSGVEIVGELMTIKLFYFVPDFELKGKHAMQGDVIGVSQDITQRYFDEPEMLPHVHLQIEHVDPAFFMDDKWLE